MAVVFACCALPFPCFSVEFLHLVLTSDIHGWVSTKYIYPGKKAKGLLHIADAIRKIRRQHPHMILLDSGDLLSGSPLLFYYNHVQPDPLADNIFFRLFNSLDYNAVSVGNHDLDIYRQLIRSYAPNTKYSMLAANLTQNGEMVLPPYIVLKKKQFTIAILGLMTTGSLMWNRLAQDQTIMIESTEAALRRWLSTIREMEKPDLTIGLFHIGLNPLRDDENSKRKRIPPANDLRTVLYGIENLDIVVSGHDHRLHPYRSEQKIRYIHGIPVVSAGHSGEALLKLRLHLVRSPGKWKIDQIETHVIKANQADHLADKYVEMLPDRYKMYIQSELPWRIEKANNRQASACFNQLLAKAHLHNGIHGTLFPKIRVRGIRLRVGNRIRRADLFRWIRYHNTPITVRMNRRDIHLLRHPSAEYGKRRIASNRQLFFWSESGLGSDNQSDHYWWPDAEIFDRRFLLKVSNYHAYGGGGLMSALFFEKEDFKEDSPRFLKENLFQYLNDTHETLPSTCFFLKPAR